MRSYKVISDRSESTATATYRIITSKHTTRDYSLKIFRTPPGFSFLLEGIATVEAVEETATSLIALATQATTRKEPRDPPVRRRRAAPAARGV